MTPRVSRAFFSHFDSWSLPGEQTGYHTVEDNIATGPVQDENADPARTNCTSRISSPSRRSKQNFETHSSQAKNGPDLQEGTKAQAFPPSRAKRWNCGSCR